MARCPSLWLVFATGAAWSTGCGSVQAPAAAGRYMRLVEMPPATSGVTCVTLDTAVLGHAARADDSDFQVLSYGAAGAGRAVAFQMTESGAAAGEPEVARPFAVRAGEGGIEFSLAMPHRPYSAVDLSLDLHDFTGLAAVTGVRADGGQTWLGQHVIFDRSAEGLGRSTRVELAEEQFAQLHVKLQLWDLRGRPVSGLHTEMVQAAGVPQSRETQTVYTTVASAESATAGATFHVMLPAHVPVERVVVTASGEGDFLRKLTVRAEADGVDDEVEGVIRRVHLRVPGQPETTFEELALPVALAANLRRPAVLTLQDAGGTGTADLHRVEVQMRQRQVCFLAEPDAAYRLVYGGAKPERPVTAADTGSLLTASHAEAILGPERAGPDATPPLRWKTWLRWRVWLRWKAWLRSQPELTWVAVLGVIGLLGAWVRLHLRQGRQWRGGQS